MLVWKNFLAGPAALPDIIAPAEFCMIYQKECAKKYEEFRLIFPLINKIKLHHTGEHGIFDARSMVEKGAQRRWRMATRLAADGSLPDAYDQWNCTYAGLNYFKGFFF